VTSALPAFLAAGLLLASALVKLRAAARMEMGAHLPSVLEASVGLALPVLALSGGLSARFGLAALLLALVLLLGSSLHLAARVRHRNDLRERTEGRRLETYVRYLSDQENGAP